MSETTLPERVDPFRLAGNTRPLEGLLEASSLPRLVAAGIALAAPARVSLRFGREHGGQVKVFGSAQAELALQCQRCLGSMTWPVDTTFEGVVLDEGRSIEELPVELEPVMLEDGRISVWALVEDELLLALPTVPMHADDRCPDQPLKEFSQAEVETLRKQEDNPFAALGALKGRLDDDG
ncbi:hypothetical protein M911_09595 [Ectothiorhodospira haloalkaliphila]|uniref:Large ribosomal RNA subunit accumulation protein YceD n=1 Tax=Ectothiorhodospira haloalkaliphila TaxID=421628 RepID=W8KJK9_9GAMM|nr:MULTISPECIES: YceD family protein [Ectothiorhodospira]AHK79358.1 hypothetical protein M911_09595 [Ectothiorhodospira haloalkaliphila]MCG5494859.1 YceD family protein [Ectothiorhodospira variabilis]MCG5497736.1 YceD family protein [Ectothiorhodospira variabilis]MCG5504372.1 YceD family protein [Ectothiorhodospira variabilis]MCG5507527.1 YceD family protein [Ectothiorhodospira variabilis]